MAFYELRQYKIKPGKMSEWLEFMEDKIIPFQVSKGAVISASFKGETDDIRDSLSIKLLNKLKKLKLKINQSDEYYKDVSNISKNQLIKKSQIIIIGAPHLAYRKIKISKNKHLIDIWNFILN